MVINLDAHDTMTVWVELGTLKSTKSLCGGNLVLVPVCVTGHIAYLYQVAMLTGSVVW